MGHCQKVVQESKDLAKYNGLVAVSGDGLPYEVVKMKAIIFIMFY